MPEAETFTHSPGGWADRITEYVGHLISDALATDDELTWDDKVDERHVRLDEARQYAELVVMLRAEQDRLNAKDFNAPTVDRQAAIDAAKLDEIRLLLQPIIDIRTKAFTPDSFQMARDIMAIVEGAQ